MGVQEEYMGVQEEFVSIFIWSEFFNRQKLYFNIIYHSPTTKTNLIFTYTIFLVPEHK